MQALAGILAATKAAPIATDAKAASVSGRQFKPEEIARLFRVPVEYLNVWRNEVEVTSLVQPDGYRHFIPAESWYFTAILKKGYDVPLLQRCELFAEATDQKGRTTKASIEATPDALHYSLHEPVKLSGIAHSVRIL